MSILKSIGSVLLGFLTVVVLSTVTDMILEKTGILPPATDQGLYVTWILALALLYRTIYTVLAGYLTAWTAPLNPKTHVMVLGILGTIGGLIGVVVGWDLSSHWYPISLAVLAYPSVWLGGKLKIKNAEPLTF